MIKDRTNISQYLTIFSRKGKIYKALVHDPKADQPQLIEKPNDLARGAIHNQLEWTARFAIRLSDEFPLIRSSGHLLAAWGKFLGIPNSLGQADNEYRQRILGIILAIIGTMPVIKRLIPQGSPTIIKEAHEIGFYLDNAYMDTSIDRNNQVSAVFTHPRCAIYVFFEDIFAIDKPLLGFISKLKIAGVGLYAGVIADDPELGTMYLDSSFINRDYIG
ncbi:hypothetical protein [Leptospira sp. GIMC2001]|uniref:hypothetical protein n=1 Tax=Leptospira sp. GIMC2001 TaxID=1513297 RepID=UPI00234A018F|nr:hypothetical protein [Leptospira sp. GIMC2001]WCL51431.1 hypothetical protein O4O04_20155 [Leptospira sp. GIMC2001]